jgi:DNA-directed RNA polymerase specialized sigma24 family protein
MTTDQPRPDDGNTVKSNLTSKHRRRRVENDEYAAFTRRILRAYARRIATGDIDAIADLSDLFTEVEAALGKAIIGLHLLGYSWADIGQRLGVTRQAAHQRWGTSSHD